MCWKIADGGRVKVFVLFLDRVISRLTYAWIVFVDLDR